MEYIKKAVKDIRENWFGDHEIRHIEGEEGFQRITWGEKGTNMYKVNYVFSGNRVFVGGDVGDAAYSLPCQATLENIRKFDLSAFMSHLTAHEKKRWDFDADLAQAQIEEYILDWCDVEQAEDLQEHEVELLHELLGATINWDVQEHFQTAVFSIYDHSDIEWFDAEAAGCIADCGKRLNRSLIAYWVGLQMIGELERSV